MKTEKGKELIFHVNLEEVQDNINRIMHNFDNKLDFRNRHHLVNQHRWSYSIV